MHTYINLYGLLFIFPNRRILILEHHLQKVSTHLHIYTFETSYFKKQGKRLPNLMHTYCFFMDCFSFLQIIRFIFWNTIYKMCLHIYTSTHLHIYTYLRLHISKSKVKVHRFGVLLYWVVILKILLSWKSKSASMKYFILLFVSGSSGENERYNNRK